MSDKATIRAVREIYDHVIGESKTLQTYPKLTPFFELRARKIGRTYDVCFRLFLEFEAFIPISLLPPHHHEVLASLIESNQRTRGFAVARRNERDVHEILFSEFTLNLFLFAS